ncbi:MAG: Ig-like domain-containing protein [Acidimicrobiales bacterium]
MSMGRFAVVAVVLALLAAGMTSALVAPSAQPIVATTCYGPSCHPKQPTRTTLAVSENPSNTDQQVTYTASVTAVHGDKLVNGGTVEFAQQHHPLKGCARVPVVNGRATCTTVYHRPGRYPVTAYYSGDRHFFGSTSGTITEVVRSEHHHHHHEPHHHHHEPHRHLSRSKQ